ncbi:hypothetical protein ACJ73_04264 [Blastomyces percursus]|uniref:Uncharacterized protein n=1 Tax=Blastomyces percursus TaxID=1658174 RepID=A0A1J9Q8I1_9EURO|nr:hypothetical protein ACJ73_04264 [Blastomyces percursus]
MLITNSPSSDIPWSQQPQSMATATKPSPVFDLMSRSLALLGPLVQSKMEWNPAHRALPMLSLFLNHVGSTSCRRAV